MKRKTKLMATLAALLACLSAHGGIGPILGGELSNSAATSVADIDEVMPRMAALGLNTVLVPAYWELTEPEEGHFDFTLIDRTIARARENRLRVVFLWFGAWKNSMSCYAPAWFKRDTRRFPRAMTAEGKQMEIASCFSPSVLQADLKAFTALAEHIKEQTDVVVMLQIENEIGMLESARDHSQLAEAAWNSPIPKELLATYGQGRTQKTWAQLFGQDDIYGEERFMAYHYARYVEQLAQAARAIIPDMPLYVNAAMNSRGRKPGEYPSAGPLAHLYDEWHAGAPSIDILAPDIYDTGFKQWAAAYAMPQRPQDVAPSPLTIHPSPLIKNRLFIPESRCCQNSGARALYVFGEHQALGFSPFAIDQASPAETESVTQAYALMRQIVNSKLLNSKSTWGLLFDQADKERVINDDGVVVTARHYFTLPWDPRATDGTEWPEGGAILVRLAPHDYLLAGTGVVLEFKTPAEKAQEEQTLLGEDGFAEAGGRAATTKPRNQTFKGKRLGLLSVDQVAAQDDGRLTPLRRLNGDQTHQGRHARIAVGDWQILHIRVYEY